MSTRCNIIVKDGYGNELIFYRHSDGYPDGAMPLLQKFLKHVKEGPIRDNVGQAAGWLILLGAAEYQSVSAEWFSYNRYCNDLDALPMGYDSNMGDWKCGSIEPTTGIHGDIEFLYIVDLKERKIDVNPVYKGSFGTWNGKPSWA